MYNNLLLQFVKPFSIMRFAGIWYVNSLPYNNLISALKAITNIK